MLFKEQRTNSPSSTEVKMAPPEDARYRALAEDPRYLEEWNYRMLQCFLHESLGTRSPLPRFHSVRFFYLSFI